MAAVKESQCMMCGFVGNFSGILPNSENIAVVIENFWSNAVSYPEISGQGIITSNSGYGATGAEEVCSGHVAQWKELLSDSGEDAGSKLEAEVPPCPHVFGTHTNSETIEQEENKNQAHRLEREPLRLKGFDALTNGVILFKSFAGHAEFFRMFCYADMEL